IAGEQRLAERYGLLRGEAVEAVRRPGFLAGLDDDRGDVVAELIGMDLEPAMLGLFECKGERGEFTVRAQPDEAALADRDIGLEHRRMARAGLAVYAVGGNDEIGIRERRRVVDFRLKVLLHAQRAGTL